AGYVSLDEADRPGPGKGGAGFSLDYELGGDSGWRLVLEAPIGPYAAALGAYGERITILILLGYVVVIVATAWASGLIVFSLESLRRSALRFTENADHPELVAWPDSKLLEVASLSEALKTASLLLDRRYRELESARDEAERANRAKERLLASVSHDIRGPVGGIVNIAESLEAEAERPEIREYAALIKETGTGLHLLLDELLDRSAMDSGAFELRPAPFDLVAAVAKAAKGFGVAAAAKGLAFAWEADGGLPVAVRGDRRRLDQILGNLVGNALKYTATGSIAFAVRDEGREAGRRLVRFEVRDSGPGMTPEELGRVFDPYWRGSFEGSGIAGSGLGLAIVKDLVTRMGGRIGAESEPGRGSVFAVVLPFEELAGTKPSARRILVADDERINRVFARRTLEKAGHAVAEAMDGRAAVAAAVAEDYDLVILDLVMPGLDGPAAAKAIRDARGRARPRVVALSARALSDGERRELLETGFDALLRKPVTAEDLLAEADMGTREAAPADGGPAGLFAADGSAGAEGRLGGEAVDLDGLLAAYHGDESFRRNLLEILVADGSRRLAELRKLDPARDAAGSVELVHSLVNILGTGKARRAYAAFLALEAALRGDLVEDKARLAASAFEEAEKALAFARERLAEGPGGD
ncbi:MAG: response regulator, partial [Spirochaetaceae bacterium]|nr:response regulator [Spirochaetaceae bacterium]